MPSEAIARRPSTCAALALAALIAAELPASGQDRVRRNYFGMHNLKDGGVSIPEGMNWTRHLVGEGGYVFDWVRGDYGRWVVDAMDRGLIPCLRIQDCNGGCDPDPGFPATVVGVIREHLERHRPEYLNRLVYLQIWNEPGDPRDFVTPEDFADFLVAAYSGVKQADANGVFRAMTPGQNGSDWWRRAIRHNPAVCQAFDVWATHPYPESYPPHYNHHDGVPYINQVKTIDSYLLDLDAVAEECQAQGSPRRGFPVMITETAYGDRLGISFEGYPKTSRGAACTTDGPCEFLLASQYNVAAFGDFWRRWPEIAAVHPFILNNWSWDPFAFVSRTSGSRNDGPTPEWCPPQDVAAATPWPPGYSQGAQRCGLPTAPYPQYVAILDLPKPPPAALEPYRGPVGVIRGTLRRADTGAPVKHATVFTDGYAFGGPSLYDGQYVIRDVPAGAYTLSVEKVGYAPAAAAVSVEEGRASVVDFDLVYRGKVSRGIYFQNQGTCDGCDLFAPWLAQSFVLPPDVGFVKFAAAMPNVGGAAIRFSIREGGPDGPQVGPAITARPEWGGEMIGAEWPGDGVPVEPGGEYFLRVERADGQGVYLYGTDANPYAAGMAWTAGTPHPDWDLFATLRGHTVAVDTAVGDVAGAVRDAASAPLGGALIAAEPGAHATRSAADGRYALTALPEGRYSLTASLDGFLPGTASVDVVTGTTATADFTLERDLSVGAIAGRVSDTGGAPLAGAGVAASPGGAAATTDPDGLYRLGGLAVGTYTLSVSLAGFEEHEETGVVVEGGRTAEVDVSLAALPEPPPPESLIANGDFSQGLEGWSLWTERGALGASPSPGGQAQLAGTGINGGLYQTFATGGAGRRIEITGYWASDPTAPQAQWAEVLVIDGPRIPSDGQDLSAAQSDVELVYKNDTWASPGGWSGEMGLNAPVHAAGSFVSSGETATLVLKTGNLLGVHSGARFDDLVVRGPDTAPPANRAPSAELEAAPTSGVAPLAVSFDASGSSDPDGDALAYAWDFGDGAQASGVAVSHSYTAAGDYTATLTVDDGRGGTAQAIAAIRVDPPPNRPPTASAAASPLSGVAPLEVSFDASGSSDPDGDALAYAWDFGDGASAAGVSVAHTYSAAGSFQVALTVSDGAGGVDQAVLTVTVDPPPVPDALIVNGDFSQGLTGWTLWTERGAIASSAAGGQGRLSGTGINGGLYQTFSTGGAGREITVDGFWASDPTAPQAQWAEVLVINGSRAPVQGQDVSAAQADVELLYKNDTWASPGGWSGAMEVTAPVHAEGRFVAAGGTATIVLKTGNLLGVHSGARFDDVVVRGSGVSPPPNRSPVASATASPESGAAPLTVGFDASASSDPDGDALSFAWDFGDGGQGTGVGVSHTYAVAGAYTATLTVADGRGGADSASVAITVSGAPPPVPEWDPRLDSLGLDVVPAQVAAGSGYWKLVAAAFESDGEILPPPGGGSESGGTHSIYVRALAADGAPLEGQAAIVSWPRENPQNQVTILTKGAVDGFWGDFPMSGGNWCPFFPEGPPGPYLARVGGAPSDEVRGMGMPCNRHVSFRFTWRWTVQPAAPAGSKLTIHAGFGGPLSMQFVERARPGLIKILDSFSAAPEIKQRSPETQIIGRAFAPSQPMDGDPVQRARQWWDANRALILQYPDVDYWEGYNEPIIQTPELMGWYASFEAERVKLLAEHGLRACIGNFSVGNPDLPLWPAFYPAIDAALAHGGILGLHEYGTPMQQHFDEASGEGWFCGRYRKLYRQFLIPTGRVIPLAITECGVDVVPPVGWKNHFSGEEYLEQLRWYDGVLREDDFVLGATIFALEIPGWGDFDIAPIAERLADYVASQRPEP